MWFKVYKNEVERPETLTHVNSQLSSLSLVCWYHLFTLYIRPNIIGSVAFQVLLPIDLENPPTTEM